MPCSCPRSCFPLITASTPACARAVNYHIKLSVYIVSPFCYLDLSVASAIQPGCLLLLASLLCYLWTFLISLSFICPFLCRLCSYWVVMPGAAVAQLVGQFSGNCMDGGFIPSFHWSVTEQDTAHKNRINELSVIIHITFLTAWFFHYCSLLQYFLLHLSNHFTEPSRVVSFLCILHGYHDPWNLIIIRMQFQESSCVHLSILKSRLFLGHVKSNFFSLSPDKCLTEKSIRFKHKTWRYPYKGSQANTVWGICLPHVSLQFSSFFSAP